MGVGDGILAGKAWREVGGAIKMAASKVLEPRKNIPLISFTSLFTLLIYLRRTNRLVIDSHEQSRVCCVSS